MRGMASGMKQGTISSVCWENRGVNDGERGFAGAKLNEVA